jgi:hypothetical protein
MDTNLFSRFAPMLREMNDAEFAVEIKQPERLLIDSGFYSGKRIEVVYAPFDHVNNDAEIVIVGLTPGRQQMCNALNEARRCLQKGCSDGNAMSAAKVFASFSGPMRTNLVAMLDSVGVNKFLGISSTESLWHDHANRVHFTSALRYPVFIEGANFSGAPSMLTMPLLRDHLMKWFAKEMAALPKAIFVPLGPKVTEAVEAVTRQLGIDRDRVLSGLPHPSGANAERIAFFLGRKARGQLSTKVNADRLMTARTLLEAKIMAL